MIAITFFFLIQVKNINTKIRKQIGKLQNITLSDTILFSGYEYNRQICQTLRAIALQFLLSFLKRHHEEAYIYNTNARGQYQWRVPLMPKKLPAPQ